MTYELDRVAEIPEDELTSARDEWAAEGQQILDSATGEHLEPASQTRWEALCTALDALRERHDQYTRLRGFAGRPGNRLAGASFGPGQQRDGQGSTAPATTRDRAMRCLDRAVHDEQMPGEAAERVERLMDTGAYETRSRAEQWAAATGDEHYATAFAKIIGDPQRGHMLWTPDEQRAYAQVQNIRAALSTGAGNGGEMVPLTLEPAVMLTSDGSINPLRRIARVVQTATNAWQGVTSAGATAEWLPTEGTEAGDGAPGFESPIVPVYLGDVDVLFSYQVEQDAANFLPELQRVMVDAADQLQAEAFTTGAAGPVEPTGIVTALDAATPSLIVTGDGSEALMSADVFKIQNALPPRWSPRAQWMASLGVINAIRQFESSNGSVLFPELANGRLLGRAMNENSGMLAAPAVSATQDNYLAIYGDFSGFVIADRIGTTLEILPGYGAAAHRPTAQRHAFMTFRTGSDLVVPSFRMLNVATSA